MQHAVWVVLPAYNEGPVISSILANLQQQPYSVVVVDDGSEDDTAARVQAYPVYLLRHACNLGQGAALQTGITFAVQQPGVQYVVTFDSDGQHDASEIERLLAPLRSGEADVALGSRFLQPSSVVNISPLKHLVLKLALWYTKLTTHLTITDTHNGFRAFTVEAARKLNIVQNRMAHASEILTQVALLHLRYVEVPVTVHYTAYAVAKGQSVLNSLNILWDTMRMRVR